MDKTLEDKLLKIAQQTIFIFNQGNRDSLESKRNDDDDFIEVAIWELREALETAYKTGYKDGQNAKQ